jgi:Raf kinase inhibitor-like YbhB/YbcL family protein
MVMRSLQALLWAGLASVWVFSHPAFAKATPNTIPGFKVSTPQHHGYWPKAQEFNQFGCTGQNQSPALTWQGVPKGTKSLAVTVYDPDAPTGSGWWHWLVVNLPPTTTQLAAGGPLPAGAIQGRNDYGTADFGGACPPQGDKPHRYILTVWALNVDKLPITEQASGALVGYYVNAHAVGKASATVRYGRPAATR